MTEEHDGSQGGKALRRPVWLVTLAGIGFACFTAWVSCAFFNVQLYAQSSLSPEALLDQAYLTSIISLIATFAFIFHYSQQVERLLEKRSFVIAITALVSVSTILLAFSGIEGVLGTFCLVTGGILSGVFSALMLQGWGRFFAHIANPYHAVLTSIVGYLLSMFINVPFTMFAPLVSVIVAALLPVVSTVLFFAVQRANESLPPQRVTGTKLFGEAAGKKGFLSRTLKRAIVTIVLWCAAYEFIRTLYIQGGLNTSGPTVYAQTMGVAALFLLVILSLVALGLYFYPKSFDMSYPYRATLLLSILGIGSFPFCYLGANAMLPYAVHMSAWQAFSLEIWVVTIVLSAYSEASGPRVFAALRGCWAFGGLLGIILGRVGASVILQNQTAALAMSLAAILLITSCYLFIFNEKIMSTLTRFFPEKTPGRFQRKCEEVARLYKLSPREAEVMGLLARGRNVEVIMDELTLSNATVCTHRQHIYQKIDVHSQQELIDVIEQTTIEQLEADELTKKS